MKATQSQLDCHGNPLISPTNNNHKLNFTSLFFNSPLPPNFPYPPQSKQKRMNLYFAIYGMIISIKSIIVSHARWNGHFLQNDIARSFWSFLLPCLPPLAVPHSPTFCGLLLISLSRVGGERAGLNSLELSRPAVVGDSETYPINIK